MATATRTKRAQIQAKPIIKDNEQLDERLGDLCAVSTRINAREAEIQEKITAIRETYREENDDDLADKARLEKDIEEYCTYYRDDVFAKGRKSLDLTHGTVDFRQHPPAVVVSKKQRMTVAAVLDKIKDVFGKKADTYIRTKEDLNKDVLVTLPEDQLATIGLEIQRKETFGITLNLEQMQPAGTNTARVVGM